MFKIEDIFKDWNVFDLWSKNENIAKDFLKLLDNKGINIKQRLIEDAKLMPYLIKIIRFLNFVLRTLFLKKSLSIIYLFLEYWSLTKHVEDLKDKYKELKNSLNEIVYTFKNKDISKLQQEQIFLSKKIAKWKLLNSIILLTK